MTNLDPVDLHVGHRLKMRRSALRLSSWLVANNVNLAVETYDKMERGECRIGTCRLMALSKELGVEIPYFFQGYHSKADADAFSGGLAKLTQRETTLLEEYRKLSSLEQVFHLSRLLHRG